jgi:hypothetical protein
MVGPYNMLVPVGVIQNSSDVFSILDPDSGGSATFTVRLSANGLEPATYYGARTMLEQSTVNALTTMSTTQFMDYVNQLAAQRGRNPVGSVTAFKNSLLMGQGDFWAFVAANGLQRIVTA